MFPGPIPGKPPERTRSIVLAALLTFTLPAAATATGPPRLASLIVSGNDAVGDDDIRAAAGMRRGAPLTDSAVTAAIGAVAGLYRARAFYGADARPLLVNYSPDSADADLSISVREGTRATFGRLELRGNAVLPSESAAALVPLSEGDPLEPGAIEAGLAGILGWYERAGYPFASASVAGIDDAGGGSMTLTIGIVEGGAAIIDRIRVTGNTETAERVILREARMDLPGPYDPAAVARFTGRLRRLGIFSSVSEPTLYQVPAIRVGDGSTQDAAGYGLLVNVAEGRTSTFDGILGYAPSGPGSGAGTFSGSVLLGFRNLFGTGRKLDAAWMKPGSGTQEISVSYEEPWAFGFPVNLGGGFLQRRQDSTYVETRWRLSAEFLVSASLSVSGIVESQGVVPSSGPAGQGIAGSNATTGGAVVRYDTRDDREIPRSGVDFRSEYRSGRKTPTTGESARATIRHIGFDFDLYVPAGGRQVIAVAFHGREVSTDDPGPADLYRLGGFRTLRGFREEQFSGVITAWGAAEYRFLTGGRSFFYGFFDPGYVKEAGDSGDFFTYGYGVGMRLETAIGLVGVSFALGEGDPIAQTKIHFGLINSF
jgi:outer membrane protein insertion porin family